MNTLWPRAMLLCLLTLCAFHANAGMTAEPSHEASLPNDAVPAVDARRYAGLWYEIAHLPMPYQKDCVGDTTALYTPQDGGTLAVRNRCRIADGSYKVVDGEARQSGDSTAKLEVRFAPGWLSWLPAVWGDYWVIALDDNYRWAMVGTPKADYLWVLSRTPHMDEALYDTLIDTARRMGYPVGMIERTPQTKHETAAKPSRTP